MIESDTTRCIHSAVGLRHRQGTAAFSAKLSALKQLNIMGLVLAAMSNELELLH